MNRHLRSLATGATLFAGFAAATATTFQYASAGSPYVGDPDYVPIHSDASPRGLIQVNGDSRSATGRDYLNILAARLGVSTTTVALAMRATSLQVLDYDQAAGFITASDAADVRASIYSGELVLYGYGRSAYVLPFAPAYYGTTFSDLGFFLGIDALTLQNTLQSGYSLAAIASVTGVTRDELKGFLTNELVDSLNAQVLAGTLSSSEASAQLFIAVSQLDARIDGQGYARIDFLSLLATNLGTTLPALVGAMQAASLERLNADLAAGLVTVSEANAIRAAILSGAELLYGFGVAAPSAPISAGLLAWVSQDAVAAFLYQSTAQLNAKLATGQSLSGIALEAGRTRAELRAFLIDEITANLNAAVNAGQLTTAQALAELQAAISTLNAKITGVFPGWGPTFSSSTVPVIIFVG